MTSTVHLDNPKTLQLLIEENRDVISPLMVKPGTVWSNVWGDIDETSPVYMDIVTGKKT